MPIDILPETATPFIGYGVNVVTLSNAAGSFVPGTTVTLSAFTDVDFTLLSTRWVLQTTQALNTFNLRTDTPGFVLGDQALAVGDTAHVQVQIKHPDGTILDSGTAALPWKSNSLELPTLGFQVDNSAGGGFTTNDRTTLELVAQSSVLDLLVDALTLENLTPLGPTSQPVARQLPTPSFGVIVRIASVGSGILPDTPDGDYFVPTLAVVRLFRGADMWLRVPVHTSSKIVNFHREGITAALPQVFGVNWFLDMSLQVTFRPDVTGSVFLMRLP